MVYFQDACLVASATATRCGLSRGGSEIRIGESMYDQKHLTQNKLIEKFFLTDSGRICHVK